jgi:hypothetical protein
MKKSVVFILLPLILIALSTGCKKDNKGEPPVLPPAESMTIDFSNFTTQAKGDLSVAVPKGTQTSNWDYAASVAVIWSTIININLAVPVAAFKIAVNQSPTYLQDATWQWSYNATILTVTYKVRLTGQITSENVDWKMYITREGTGGFSEFMWFEGTSSLDGTSGQWTLNKSYQSQVPILKIDWTKSGSSVGMIKYTYVETGNAFNGSYIEYGLTTNTLNAYYTIHYYSTTYLQFYDLNVEWNTTSHNGHVKSEGYFGDNSWYCWDSNYLNVTCS